MENEVELKKTIKVKKIKWKDKYKRALADHQNLIKKQSSDQAEFVKYANSSLLEELIPVYSYLKLSIAHAPEEDNSWLEGVKYVAKQFKDVLISRGVKEIVVENVMFNPEVMEAMEEEATEDKSLDSMVAKELSAGYTLNERTIVPAKVAVYKYNN